MALKIPNTKNEINLECPVCLTVPRSTPIYQCGNGHLLCKDCKPRLRECPICKTKCGFESASNTFGGISFPGAGIVLGPRELSFGRAAFSFGTSSESDHGSFSFGGPSYGSNSGFATPGSNMDQRSGIRNLMAEQLIES